MTILEDFEKRFQTFDCGHMNYGYEESDVDELLGYARELESIVSGIWLSFERGILVHRKDHACAACVPGGPLTGTGFVCDYHRIQALKEKSK